MPIESTLLAVNSNLLAFPVYPDDMMGQLSALSVLTVAAAESAIGSAIPVITFRIQGTIAVESINCMKGQAALIIIRKNKLFVPRFSSTNTKKLTLNPLRYASRSKEQSDSEARRFVFNELHDRIDSIWIISFSDWADGIPSLSGSSQRGLLKSWGKLVRGLEIRDIGGSNKCGIIEHLIWSRAEKPRQGSLIKGKVANLYERRSRAPQLVVPLSPVRADEAEESIAQLPRIAWRNHSSTIIDRGLGSSLLRSGGFLPLSTFGKGITSDVPRSVKSEGRVPGSERFMSSPSGNRKAPNVLVRSIIPQRRAQNNQCTAEGVQHWFLAHSIATLLVPIRRIQRNSYVRDSSSTTISHDAENDPVFHSHMRPKSGLAIVDLSRTITAGARPPNRTWDEFLPHTALPMGPKTRENPVPTAPTARLARRLNWDLVGIIPFPGQMVGCGIYSTRSGTDVDGIITTSLFVPLGMLNATLPTGVTCGDYSFGKCLSVWSALDVSERRSLHPFTLVHPKFPTLMHEFGDKPSPYQGSGVN
eukprot:Gb_01748 [translate_table: standard]